LRTESLLSLAVLLAVCLPGCAPKFKSAKKADGGIYASGPEHYAEQQRANRDSFGNTKKPSPWQRMTAAVKDSVKPNSPTAQKKKSPPSQPAHDPLHLANNTGPPSPQLHLEMAKQLERSGNAHGAYEQFKRALALEPQNLDALLGMAHLMDRQGQFEQAVHYYEIATRHHPHVPGTFNDLGLCLARMKQLEKSLGPLNRAVALNPQRTLYRNNVATVLVEMGRTDEAFEHLRAAHGESIAHYNVGYLLQQRGQSQSAAEHFARAATIDPSFAAARQWADQLGAQVGQANLPPVHAASHPGGDNIHAAQQHRIQ
jgi:tetratricopeptide (TPR) repeat protein